MKSIFVTPINDHELFKEEIKRKYFLFDINAVYRKIIHNTTDEKICQYILRREAIDISKKIFCNKRYSNIVYHIGLLPVELYVNKLVTYIDTVSPSLEYELVMLSNVAYYDELSVELKNRLDRHINICHSDHHR